MPSKGQPRNPRGTTLDVKDVVGTKPWRRLHTGNHRILLRLSDGVLMVGRMVDRKELEQAVHTLPD